MIANRRCLSIIILLVILVSVPHAQEQTGAALPDTVAMVPALRDFHTVIFTIWHTAWPAKDTAMLTALVPDIVKGTEAILSAPLPGILREKADAWKKGVGDLRAIVEQYRNAAAAKENQRLLDAAEKLHAQYERLVRIIRPPLKELEGFHATLYTLYHYDMPQDSLERIRSTVNDLKSRMAVLNGAQLPPRLKAREETFLRARTDLSRALDELIATVPTNDLAAIKQAIEVMHGKYEALAKTLE